MRQTLPFDRSLLWVRVNPSVTAAWSQRMPRVKECRWSWSSASTAVAVIQAGRRSRWRLVIISASAVTSPAVALSRVLRALTGRAGLPPRR